MQSEPVSAVKRILRRVEVTDAGCWVWQGALNHGGYGIIQLGRGIGTDRTHRVMYEARVGPIPAGLTLDHLCHVTQCCNPNHLEPVTRAENARRQWRDGRGSDVGAAQRAVTHCPRDHPYDEANTRLYRGRRFCRACARERMRARRAQAKALAAQQSP